MCFFFLLLIGLMSILLLVQLQELKRGKVKVLVADLCLTLCDPLAYSPPVSSVLGILQARILE